MLKWPYLLLFTVILVVYVVFAALFARNYISQSLIAASAILTLCYLSLVTIYFVLFAVLMSVALKKIKSNTLERLVPVVIISTLGSILYIIATSCFIADIYKTSFDANLFEATWVPFSLGCTFDFTLIFVKKKRLYTGCQEFL